MNYLDKCVDQLRDILAKIEVISVSLQELKTILENPPSIKYEVKPVKETCYVDGCAVWNYELSFEDSDTETATKFSIYERNSDGDLR